MLSELPTSEATQIEINLFSQSGDHDAPPRFVIKQRCENWGRGAIRDTPRKFGGDVATHVGKM
jgi:hypothetical protein